MTRAVRETLRVSTKAFVNEELGLAQRVEPLEEVIDDLCDEMKLRHVERLQKGGCTIVHGFVFNDLITNFERVSDHCSNIAVAINRSYRSCELIRSCRAYEKTQIKPEELDRRTLPNVNSVSMIRVSVLILTGSDAIIRRVAHTGGKGLYRYDALFVVIGNQIIMC